MIGNDTFVIDAVVHAYNLSESNYRVPEYAAQISDMVYDSWMKATPPALTLPKERYLRDWSVEETANMLFRESSTDIAVFHPTPINVYHDGLTSVEKAKEARERWPTRFETLATVDPTAGEAALEELERQVDMLDPLGVKLYPSSWAEDGGYTGWQMSDDDIAYPVFEKAYELGLELVAVHKALPLGPVPMDDFHQEDVESAATNFPELNFSIVHGGMAFTEEAAWQIARYDNIYINLEVLVYMAYASPGYFEDTFAGLFKVGGADVIDQLYWGSGCMGFHPQPQLEAFWEFEFSDDVLKDRMFDLPEMDESDKRKILSGNFAEMLDLNISDLRTRIADDEFSEQAKSEGLAAPYSTTDVADAI